MVAVNATMGQVIAEQRLAAFMRSQSDAWHVGYGDQKHIPSKTLVDTGNLEWDHAYNPHPTRSQEWSDYRDGVKFAYEEDNDDE